MEKSIIIRKHYLRKTNSEVKIYESGYTSQLSRSHGDLRLRRYVQDWYDQGLRSSQSGYLQQLPPLLHGQAEAGGYRRSY